MRSRIVKGKRRRRLSRLVIQNRWQCLDQFSSQDNIGQNKIHSETTGQMTLLDMTLRRKLPRGVPLLTKSYQHYSYTKPGDIKTGTCRITGRELPNRKTYCSSFNTSTNVLRYSIFQAISWFPLYSKNTAVTSLY